MLMPIGRGWNKWLLFKGLYGTVTLIFSVNKWMTIWHKVSKIMKQYLEEVHGFMGLGTLFLSKCIPENAHDCLVPFPRESHSLHHTQPWNLCWWPMVAPLPNLMLTKVLLFLNPHCLNYILQDLSWCSIVPRILFTLGMLSTSLSRVTFWVPSPSLFYCLLFLCFLTLRIWNYVGDVLVTPFFLLSNVIRRCSRHSFFIAFKCCSL